LARARNIKPGFFLNDELAEIEPLGRLLFIGLWSIADREGRLEDRVKKIKAAVLPYDNCNIDKLLQALQGKGFIIRYEVDGEGYIQVVNFQKHQNPHMREQASIIPAPDLHHASTMQAPEKHGTSPADSPSLIPDSLLLIPDSPIPIKDIVGYLNLICGTSYKSTGDKTKKLIQALWKDGFRLDDFKRVIDIKAADWLNDSKMSKFLRPETLFSNKFESYLNQVEAQNVPDAWHEIKKFGREEN